MGKVSFGKIPDSDKWDKDTLYLWGANQGNWQTQPGQSLNGGGMAGGSGPTKGNAHAQYIGIITMPTGKDRIDELKDGGYIDQRFNWLEAQLRGGKNIVIPYQDGKHSLGTGIGEVKFGKPGRDNWEKRQLKLQQRIRRLVEIAEKGEVQTQLSDKAQYAVPMAYPPPL